MNAKTKNEVAKIEPGEVAVFDYGEDAGSGFENQSNADIAIPFLNVLQSNSPICSEDDSDARPGMLANSVTGELFVGKDGIGFQPVTTRHSFIEWVPRDLGGGFVGEHAVDSEVVKRTRALPGNAQVGKLRMENGNDLIETFTIIGNQIDEEGEVVTPMIIACSSTKIKPYKGLMTRLRTYLHPGPGGRKLPPPMFAHRVRVTTFKDKNPKGDFFNLVFAPLNGSVPESLIAPGPLLEAGKALKLAFETGAVRAATETQANAAAEGDAGDDVPF